MVLVVSGNQDKGAVLHLKIWALAWHPSASEDFRHGVSLGAVCMEIVSAMASGGPNSIWDSKRPTSIQVRDGRCSMRKPNNNESVKPPKPVSSKTWNGQILDLDI